MNVIGTIDYECCDTCRHYRADGSCAPMEADNQILRVDWLTETIRCTKYEPKS